MRFKILSLLAVIALLLSFSYNANAQFMTEDLLLLKVGYVPVSPVTFDDGVTINDFKDSAYTDKGEYKIGEIESSGFAVQGEYNLIYDNFWLGFSLEYQRIASDSFNYTNTDQINYREVKAKKFNNDFIIPMISAKFAAEGGFYVGAGLSGKYLISSETLEFKNSPGLEGTFEKEIDLWANGIIGYHVPVAEGVFLDVEGRFGYNITNEQFTRMKLEDTTTSAYPEIWELTPKSAYDITFYVGVGVRPRGSEY